jgi:hypothetical protein
MFCLFFDLYVNKPTYRVVPDTVIFNHPAYAAEPEMVAMLAGVPVVAVSNMGPESVAVPVTASVLVKLAALETVRAPDTVVAPERVLVPASVTSFAVFRPSCMICGSYPSMKLVMNFGL